MKRFTDMGFVIRDGCQFEFLGDVVLLRGDIVCVDGITLTIDKVIRIVDGDGPTTAWVQTDGYRYHARLAGGQNILRYDSPHQHRPCHHKHQYDPFVASDEGAVIEIADLDDVPTIGDVLAELQEWHGQHSARIGEVPRPTRP